jgi:RHS repeat-associated protein
VLTFTVTVLPPQAQTLTANSSLSQTTYAGYPVWFYVQDNSQTGYVWSSGVTTSGDGSGAYQVWNTPGTYSVTVQEPAASDNFWAASNTVTFNVTVLPPQAQTLTTYAYPTQNVYEGQAAWFAAAGSNTGYTWSSGTNVQNNGTYATESWQAPGLYTVTVQAPGSPPLWAASNTLSFSVDVLPPQAQTITTNSRPWQYVLQGGWLPLDAEGGNTGLNWTSTGGTEVSTSNGGNNTTWAFSAPGRYTVTAQAPASTGYGTWAASNTVSFNVRVLPPRASNLSQTTSTGTAGGSFLSTCWHKLMAAIGGPVQLASGAESFSRHLFSLSGARNWNFDISYNSAISSSTTQSGAFGFGWSHPFEANVVVSGANLLVNWDSAHNNTFEPVAGSTGTYRSAEVAAMYDTLTINSGGGWTLTKPDQSQLIFSSNGSLAEDHDSHGRKLVLAYNGSGQLSTVTEPVSSTQLAFAYNGAGLISSLTDSTGATVAFSYTSAPMLATIVNQNGKRVTFGYDGNKNILTLTSNDGTVLTTNTYDSLGRVVTQADGVAGHAPIQLSYQQASLSSNIVTTSTDKTGAVSTYTFDPNFNLLSVVDPLGRTTSYTYDSADNLLSMTDPLGNVTSFTYDGSGNVLTSTDAASKVTTFTYDGQNHLLTTTDALGNVTTRTYDTNGNLLTLTDSAGNKTAWTYDANSQPLTETLPNGGVNTFIFTSGRLAQLSDPNGVVTQWSYDTDGRVVYTLDSQGNKTSFTYDAVGNQLTATNPLSQAVTRTYDARNRLVTQTDAAGAVTGYGYDNNNNLLTVTDPLGKVTTNAYDADDRLLSVTDPLGHKVSRTYDAAGEPKTATDAAGDVIQYQYDADGRRTTVTDPLGNQSSASYDTRSRLTLVTDPLSHSTAFTYDDLGRKVTSTDALGQVTALTYDSLGHLTGVMDPGDLITSQTFDSNGARTSFSNPNDKATTLTNDLGGRVTTVTTPAARATAYTFDGRGLPLTTTLPSGHATTISYDTEGRPATITDGVGTDTITRDADGRQLTVTENGQTLTRAYDLLGRVTRYSDGAGNVIGYAYDAAGNLSTLTYPDGKVVTYAYDAANRLKTVTDWANRVTTYTYDLDGRLTATARPNGTSQTRTYDAAGQLSAQTELAVDGVTVIYSTNPAYDAAGRITGETLASAVPVAVPSQTTMTYDVDNRLATLNGLATTFDADGNLLTLPGGTPPAYTYDARNRLTAAGGLSYAYDAEGHRIGVSASTGTTSYVVNPNAALTQTLMATGPDGTVTHYVYGLGLAYQESGPSGSLVVRFYHYDRRGDTVALTDGTGTVTDTAAYGIYGKLLTRTGTTGTPFLFNGLYGVMTDANGLYYHRARYYSPTLRRFINQDVTLGDIGTAASLNRYAYANGNPVSMVDPFGLMASDLSATGADVAGQLWAALQQYYYNPQDFITVPANALNTLTQATAQAIGDWADENIGTGLSTGITTAAPFLAFVATDGISEVAGGVELAEEGEALAGAADADTIAARQAIAKDFYQSAGMDDAKLESHLAGIDFTQPVDVVTIPKGSQLVQYQLPGAPTGSYFAPVGMPANTLGIYTSGRVGTTFTAAEDSLVLRSSANSMNITWEVDGWNIQAQGGGTQYFARNPTLFKP